LPTQYKAAQAALAVESLPDGYRIIGVFANVIAAVNRIAGKMRH